VSVCVCEVYTASIGLDLARHLPARSGEQHRRHLSAAARDSARVSSGWPRSALRREQSRYISAHLSASHRCLFRLIVRQLSAPINRLHWLLLLTRARRRFSCRPRRVSLRAGSPKSRDRQIPGGLVPSGRSRFEVIRSTKSSEAMLTTSSCSGPPSSSIRSPSKSRSSDEGRLTDAKLGSCERVQLFAKERITQAVLASSKSLTTAQLAIVLS
jgi:hypothetical protein